MRWRYVANQYSYVLVGSLALLAGAAYVTRDPTPGRWIAWLIAAGLMYGLYLFARPGDGWPDTAASLEQQIGQGIPVLLELYSNYCISCMLVKPALEGIELEPGVRVKVLRMDVTTPEGLRAANRFGLLTTPTFLAFDKDGQEQWRLIGGATNRVDLVNRLRRLA